MSARNRLGEQEPQGRLFLFSALLAWCVALVGVRVEWSGSGHFLFLIWNLFLAWIPLFASRLLRAAHHRRAADITQLSLLAIWLLFLPNAPYVLTDLVHLQRGIGKFFWFDLAMLLSAACTGLLLGYASLLDVHKILEERFGRLCGWLVAVACLMLSGFGVYLGRVLRWNSWDVVTNPRGLLAFIVDCMLNPAAHLYTYAVSGMFATVLLVGYAVLHFMMREYRVLRVLAPASVAGSPRSDG